MAEIAPPILLSGPGYEIIEWTFGSKTFRASRRTFAHLWETQRRLARLRRGAWIRVIQPSYNTGVAQSEGTHDFDATLDVEIVGWDDWWAEQRFLRECGWADWVRCPPTFSWHHHMISLGYTTPVGEYVPGQVDDYYAWAMGLAGQHEPGSDDTWHPADIDSTVFSFVRWRDNQEDDMPLNDADKAWIRRTVEKGSKAAAEAAVKQLLETDVSAEAGEVVTVEIALRRAGATPAAIRAARDKVLAAVEPS